VAFDIGISLERVLSPYNSGGLGRFAVPASPN